MLTSFSAQINQSFIFGLLCGLGYAIVLVYLEYDHKTECFANIAQFHATVARF